MFEPGDQIDIWVIDKRLGAGGMGSVYRCHNRDANRILAAIKVLESHVSQHPEARKRFVREAEILFGLEHPNIVKVRNVRITHQTPYIEMEFVSGQSIEDRLGRGGPLSPGEALPLFGQMASAIAYLHSKGVRHRDIKPANLLITQNGQVKLVDFGLAMEADTSRLTQGNMSFGTVSYAPPEWVEPERLDPVLWDLYATGVVFWEMLTGDVAFPVSGEGNARQQAFQVVMRKQNHAPLDPGGAFPREVRALIGHLTQADPARRMSSAAELVDALRVIDGVGHLPPAPVRPRPRSEPTLIPREGTGNTFALDQEASTEILEEDTPGPAPSALLTADIDPPEPEPAKRSSLGLVAGAIVVVVLLIVLGLAAVAGVAGMSLLPAQSADSRDVSITLQGLGDDITSDLLIDGRYPADRDGDVLRFTGVQPGEHQVQWAVGQDCGASACKAGRCGDHCLSGWRAITVPAGEAPFELPFKLASPAPRPVRLGTGDLPDGVTVAIAVEGAEGRMDGRVWKGASVRPGVYRARVLLGDCPDVPPCEDDCPPGCRDAVREIVVPVGDGRHEARLQVAAPDPVQEEPAGGQVVTDRATPEPDPVPGTPEPVTPPDPKPTTAAPLITNAQFNRWLADHPEWQAESARASGRADAFYLQEWVDGAPAAGKGGRPVQYVPHLAARAFCQSRGGLAQVTDPPTEWVEGDGALAFEWRMQGNTPAYIEANGVVSTQFGKNQSLLRTGFRCAR